MPVGDGYAPLYPYNPRKPCRRCGECCRGGLCHAAMRELEAGAIRDTGAGWCPFLAREPGQAADAWPRYVCRLMLQPDGHGARARAENAFGLGCIVASTYGEV